MKVEQVNQHLIGKSYHDIVDHLQWDEDGGDCCGWYNYEEFSGIPEDVNLSDLVLKDCTVIEYGGDLKDRCVLNFVFVDKNESNVILGYELSAGSGSGWSYGAYVTCSHNGVELATTSW